MRLIYMKYFYHFLVMISLFQPLELMAELEKKILKIAVLYDQEFLLHNTGLNHPENPNRITHAINFLKKEYKFKSNLIWPSFGYAPI